MSLPRMRTAPSTRAPITVSCIRFKHRRSVDLPHPDGPMIAVTCPSGNAIVTLRTAVRSPNDAHRRSVSRQASRAGASVMLSVAVATVAAPRDGAGGKTDDEDENDENKRANPGLRVPVVVGADGI